MRERCSCGAELEIDASLYERNPLDAYEAFVRWRDSHACENRKHRPL